MFNISNFFRNDPEQDLISDLSKVESPEEIEDLDYDFDSLRRTSSIELERRVRELIEDKGLDFGKAIIWKIVEETAKYLNELSLEVEPPFALKREPKIESPINYNFTADIVEYRDLSEAIYLPNNFHEINHKAQIKEWLGDFKNKESPENFVEFNKDSTTPQLREDLRNEIDLNNNEKFKDYILLLAVDRSKKISELLRETKSIYEEGGRDYGEIKRNKLNDLIEETCEVIEENGWDDYSILKPMESFSHFGSLYCSDNLKRDRERERWVEKLKTKYGEEAGEHLEDLFEMYDSAQGSRQERFEKVIKTQKLF